MNTDIPVFYVEATSFPTGIEAAFKKLKQELGDVHSRNFYGISWMEDNEQIVYKAAASFLPHEIESSFSLPVFVIRKGPYATVTIPDFMKNIPAIGHHFQEMLQHPAVHENGYCLERYHGTDVDCLVTLDASKI